MVSTVIFPLLISLFILMVDLLTELRVAEESSDRCWEVLLKTPAFPDPKAQLHIGIFPGYTVNNFI